jgi:hypothetical protein
MIYSILLVEHYSLVPEPSTSSPSVRKRIHLKRKRSERHAKAGDMKSGTSLLQKRENLNPPGTVLGQMVPVHNPENHQADLLLAARLAQTTSLMSSLNRLSADEIDQAVVAHYDLCQRKLASKTRNFTDQRDIIALSYESLSNCALRAIASRKGLQPIEGPVEIVRLGDLSKLPSEQGSICDVLAYVDEVSPTCEYRPSIGTKRDIRIVDSSTSKRVKLSVWVDAENFIPCVGTFALFRNLTNHRWDGGSLNAYDRCDGKDWFIPNPWRIEGVGDRMPNLFEWWKNRAEQKQ